MTDTVTNLTQAQVEKEAERVKFVREYFETGCLCLSSNGGSLQVQPESVPDAIAAVFYEQNCKCSRNY
jgi:hypothetical protein